MQNLDRERPDAIIARFIPIKTVIGTNCVCQTQICRILFVVKATWGVNPEESTRTLYPSLDVSTGAVETSVSRAGGTARLSLKLSL